MDENRNMQNTEVATIFVALERSSARSSSKRPTAAFEDESQTERFNTRSRISESPLEPFSSQEHGDSTARDRDPERMMSDSNGDRNTQHSSTATLVNSPQKSLRSTPSSNQSFSLPSSSSSSASASAAPAPAVDRPDLNCPTTLLALVKSDPANHYSTAVAWKEVRAKELKKLQSPPKTRAKSGGRRRTPISVPSLGEIAHPSAAQVQAAQQELASFEAYLEEQEDTIDAALTLCSMHAAVSMKSTKRRRGDPANRRSRLTVKERVAALAKWGGESTPASRPSASVGSDANPSSESATVVGWSEVSSEAEERLLTRRISPRINKGIYWRC